VRIKVAIHGMDKRCEDRMLTTFKMNFKGQCEYSDIDSADTVILDVDGMDAETELHSFRNMYPEKPVVVMSTTPLELTDAIYVEKPAKLNQLLNAIQTSSNKEIPTDLSANIGASTAKIASALADKSSSSQLKHQTAGSHDIYYNPEKFMQGKITEALNKSNSMKTSIFIKSWMDRWIIISPDSKYLVHNVKESQLRNLGLIQIGEEMAYSEKDFAEEDILAMADTPIGQIKTATIDTFIWDVTVRTARGRIPEGTSLDDLYVLQHWPNLPRLLYVPNAVRISAFWLDQPQSINDLSKTLSIPLSDVFTYFSACHASGGLKLAKRNEDKLISPEVIQVDNKKRGVFAALFKKMSSNVVHKKDTTEQEDN